jgi:hypothetical protein
MHSWFEFLRIDAGLAMCFIDCARLRSNPMEAARSVENARKALAEIHRCLMHPSRAGLNENEVFFLEQRCMEIEAALATF